MFKVVVTHSNDPDSLDAVNELMEKCSFELEGHIPQAGILFAAIDFDYAVILNRIQEVFPGIQLIGCSTNGELSSNLKFQQDSLTLMLFASDEIEISAGLGRNVSKDPIAAARQAVESAQSQTKSPTKLCLTFPDSLKTSGVLILDGLKEILGEVPVIGGIAADNYTFEGTYQFFQNEVLSDSVPVLLFSGNLLFSHGVASGWQPIGQKGTVTKAEGNKVYEIDGQRALDFYQNYLGKDAFIYQYAIYALAVLESESDRFYMRAPSGYDLETGSITYFADIPEQAIVQIAHVSRDEILTAAKTSLEKALQNYPGDEAEAALFISCVARRQILGTRTQEEHQLAESLMPSLIPNCGFYSYGEIAPLENQGKSHFHNQTFVSLLLGTH